MAPPVASAWTATPTAGPPATIVQAASGLLVATIPRGTGTTTAGVQPGAYAGDVTSPQWLLVPAPATDVAPASSCPPIRTDEAGGRAEAPDVQAILIRWLADLALSGEGSTGPRGPPPPSPPTPAQLGDPDAMVVDSTAATPTASLAMVWDSATDPATLRVAVQPTSDGGPGPWTGVVAQPGVPDPRSAVPQSPHAGALDQPTRAPQPWYSDRFHAQTTPDPPPAGGLRASGGVKPAPPSLDWMWPSGGGVATTDDPEPAEPKRTSHLFSRVQTLAKAARAKAARVIPTLKVAVVAAPAPTPPSGQRPSPRRCPHQGLAGSLRERTQCSAPCSLLHQPHQCPPRGVTTWMTVPTTPTTTTAPPPTWVTSLPWPLTLQQRTVPVRLGPPA